MIFQKSYRNNEGIILIDILVAFSLAMLFIVTITATSIDSRELFARASERDALLDLYESGDSRAENRLYGNEMVQNDFTVTATSSIPKTIKFTRIQILTSKPNDSTGDALAKAMGTPLCSVNFRDGNHDEISITPIILPIDPLLPLTYIEVRSGIAYISADSPRASDSDFLIFDIKDKASPFVLSSINTGPGIASIALAGKYVYVAVPSTISELHIIRLDGLNNLVLEGKFKLPLPYATATPPLASSIFYSRGNIYLGTEKWNGDEFNIIDVKDPAHPIRIGGLPVDGKINDIFVHDDLAYIASVNQSQLISVNIDNPVYPTVANTFNPSGWSRQEGKVISSFEDSLSFGRTSGGYDIATDHEIFTWPADISLSSISTTSMNISGGVYGIVTDRSNIYLSTRRAGKELQIFDRYLTASTLKTYSLPTVPQTMTCDRDRLYILSHTAPVIYEITFK